MRFFSPKMQKNSFLAFMKRFFPVLKMQESFFFFFFAHSLSSGNNEKELVGTLVFIFALYGRT